MCAQPSKVKSYVKRPVVIEAVQWKGPEDTEAVREFCQEAFIESNFPNIIIGIRTLEGLMLATPGDYIIRGIRGEFYPCKPDIFKETYEELPITYNAM